MKKPTAIYIHGYLSGANSSTGQKLKAMKGERFDILTPEVNADPQHSLKVVNELIKESNPAIIIGSSMGGLYTLACDSRETPLLLVNPLLTPVETIKEQFLNKTFPYHCQRLDGATEATITDKELKQFAEIEAKIPSLIEEKKPHLAAILSTRDELLGNSHLKILQGKIKWLYKFNDFGHRCGGSCYGMIGTLMESAIEP